MSVEETRDAVRKKLMEILEEELSVLKLKDVNKNNGNRTLNGHDQDGIVDITVDKEGDLSSSHDEAVEIIKETVKDQKAGKFEQSEASNIPSKNGAEEILSPSYPIPKSNFISKEELLHPENAKSAEKNVQEMSGSDIDGICMNNDEAFIVPSDSLVEQILERAEFYFKDYNLFKNSFLLNHIRRNKNGYINLKLFASLRKIKALAKTPRVLAYCIKKSKVLELNPESTKVRRIEPIPSIEDTPFGKTVMVFNLPDQRTSTEQLRELFSKFGTVVSAEIYAVSSPANDAYHERCWYFHRKIASKTYGVVTFERYEEAVNALNDEDSRSPNANEMVVVPLLPQISQKEKRPLKFLDVSMSNPKAIRRNDKVKTRDDFRFPIRSEKMYMGRGYYYSKRENFWNSFAGRKPYLSSNDKKFLDRQTANKYNETVPKKLEESGQHTNA